MKFAKSFITVTALSFAMSANSSDREFADIYTECGLGAMIAPNNEVVAAVTNVTWDLGTTAISSDVSSEESCAGGKSEAAAFIFDAYPNIEKDLAIGNGEHLATLLTIAGVGIADQSATASSLRKDFAALVDSDEYSEQSRYQKAESLYDLLYSVIV